MSEVEVKDDMGKTVAILFTTPRERLVKEIELWEQTVARYQRIWEVLSDTIEGLRCVGNKELNIPECSFCKEYEMECGICPFNEKVSKCGNPDSHWSTIKDNVYIAFTRAEEMRKKAEKIIIKLQDELLELNSKQ